jgi:hypothetical protein
MTPLGWLLSVVLLVWLLAMFIMENRFSRIPGMLWFLFPLLIMLIYLFLSGSWRLSLITFIALLLSERRHLQSRLLSVFALLSAAIVLFLILPWAAPSVEEGIVAICLFWIAWERKIISSQAALTLFVCVLFWMGIGFAAVYIAIRILFLIANRLASRKSEPSLRFWDSTYAPILFSSFLIMIDRGFFHLLG